MPSHREKNAYNWDNGYSLSSYPSSNFSPDRKLMNVDDYTKDCTELTPWCKTSYRVVRDSVQDRTFMHILLGKKKLMCENKFSISVCSRWAKLHKWTKHQKHSIWIYFMFLILIIYNLHRKHVLVWKWDSIEAQLLMEFWQILWNFKHVVTYLFW